VSRGGSGGRTPGFDAAGHGEDIDAAWRTDPDGVVEHAVAGATALQPRLRPAQSPRGIDADGPQLRVAPPAPVRTPRAPFVVLVLALVIAGVVGIVILNTKINENVFRLHDLKQTQDALDVREQQLQADLAEAAAPGTVAGKAKELGMLPPTRPPTFIVLPDGRRLGVPQTAVGRSNAMPPRSPDPRRTPRGGTGPEDDPAVVVPLRGEDTGARRGGLSAARRYTPRGRTVRDSADSDRAGRGDPFRPALQVVDGGERRGARGGPPRARGVTDPPSTAERGGTAERDGAAERSGAPRSGGARRVGGTSKTSGAPRIGAAARTGGTSKTGRAPRGGGAARSGAAAGGTAATRGGAAARGGRPVRVAKPRARSGRSRLPRLGEPKRRLRLATLLMLAMFMVVGGRLVQIQLTDAKAYAAEGLSNRLRHVVLPAFRGTIYDRTGAILVHSVDARYVSVDPTRVKNPEATATRLFEVLSKAGVSRSEILMRILPHKRSDGRDAQFEYLARGINASLGAEVDGLNLAGIYTGRDERRDAPGRDLAANLIGFTRQSDHKGLAGIEAGYDSILRGVEGKRTFEVGDSTLAREIPGGFSQTVPARQGGSVELTIDHDLQYTTQSILTQRARDAKAYFACAVILDTRTSDVLAQASYPTFDADDPFSTPEEQRRDTCTQTVYDPGSVHKAFVVGAALQEGVVTADSTVPVTPYVMKGGARYEDHAPQKAGTQMTLPGILALSSNVGTIKIADQLGKNRIVDYQKKFGLGTATGVGLPYEAAGKVLNASEWTGSSYGSIPIGDSVAVTNLQMAAAYAAIANDGVWTQPHLVRATTDPKGKRKPTAAPQTRQVLSAEHARELRTMLEAVTTLDDATGTSAAIEGYRVAGKTGTGLFPQGGGYADGDVTSFIGMAPADAPRFVIAVVAYVPHGTGGSVGGPAFHDMMSFTLGHFQVPPTNVPAPTFTVHR
jgi:cell division protein FtsI (penicillin-binding protein 3)